MSTPIVFFFSTSFNETPFSEPSYNASYKRLAQLAKDQNIDIRFVFEQDSFKDGRFTDYWKFESKDFIHIEEKFIPGLVYAQTRIHPDFSERVNSVFLENICRDKYKTYLIFPEAVKKTVPINKETTTKLLAYSLKTGLIVIKPRFGAEGKNIRIIKLTDFDNSQFLDQEYIAQEFIDSKNGIKDVIGKRHELRLYIFNGFIKAAYLRVPAPDSFLSNISQGATEQQINLSQIPQSTIDLKNLIDNKFINVKPRLYTIDIMYEEEKAWVVELNDMPGMPDIKVQPLTDTFFHAMLALFKESQS